MTRYFRIQWGRYSLAEMQGFNSEDGGDGFVEGICACSSADELSRNTVWTTDPRYTADAEVLVLEGHKLTDIYDGVRIFPTAIVARMSVPEFVARMEDGTIYDFE